MVFYIVDNLDISCIWLFDVLFKKDFQEDVFYKCFLEVIERLVNSDVSEFDIDIEVLVVLMLLGFFLWLVWVDFYVKIKKGCK